MQLIETGVDAPDREDFRDWVRPHWDAMCRVAARLARAGERDDVLQNALLLAWRRRDQFDPVRGSARTWLLAVTANEARKSHRSRLHLELVDRDLPAETATEPASADVDMQSALRHLPKRQRLAVELHYYVGLSVAETAQAMACAEGTVKSTLAAARVRLRTELEETPHAD